jgi:hypothetical protein
MSTRTITVHDRCTAQGCGRVLHSMSEGTHGLRSSCWVRQLKPDTRSSLNKLIASAFHSGSATKYELIDDAMAKLKRDNEMGNQGEAAGMAWSAIAESAYKAFAISRKLDGTQGYEWALLSEESRIAWEAASRQVGACLHLQGEAQPSVDS